MSFGGVVPISDGGHGDDGHPGHVGVGCAGRSSVDDVFRYTEPEGEHGEGDEKNDRDEREGIVFEDRLEAEHNSRVGPV